jgi:hypothetical protein
MSSIESVGEYLLWWSQFCELVLVYEPKGCAGPPFPYVIDNGLES